MALGSSGDEKFRMTKQSAKRYEEDKKFSAELTDADTLDRESRRTISNRRAEPRESLAHQSRARNYCWINQSGRIYSNPFTISKHKLRVRELNAVARPAATTNWKSLKEFLIGADKSDDLSAHFSGGAQLIRAPAAWEAEDV